MNKETYEALKRVVIFCAGSENSQDVSNELEQVRGWINEVAKEYNKEGEQNV